MSMQIRRRIVLGLLLCSLFLCLTGSVAVAQQTDPVSFSGRATGVQATVLGFSAVVSDTGPLPSSGGALQTSLLSASVPGLLSADVLHATTIGQADRVQSEASVADLSLTVGGNTIAASLLASQAMAVCCTSAASVSGSSQVVGLVINGQAIDVSTQPNQTIPLPNGEVIINEQQSSASGNKGSITVNALHIIVNGLADVVISSAHADITCLGAPVCQGDDFVTGGGWIISPSGAKANFGVAGGIKNGAFWGHLEYIDHGNGTKVHGTGVTAYVVKSPTTRHIEGTAEIDGADGFTYKVDVADNDDAGTSANAFYISLSNGYSAGGSLGGGNIEIHRPCQ